MLVTDAASLRVRVRKPLKILLTKADESKLGLGLQLGAERVRRVGTP